MADHRETMSGSARRRRASKLLSAVALLASAGLALSGCAAATPQQMAGTETESEWQAESFAAVYEQQLDWRACGHEFGLIDDLEAVVTANGGHIEGARCAWVEAPLDWADPAGAETIELAVIHVPATGDAPIGTLLTNPGGPGASGVESVVGLTTVAGFAEVHEHYDLLGFDPRGMARSSPIACDFETRLLELLLALCADAEPLASSMGTAQVARDMELMRALMGDEALHYAGFSYGTVIGATYATLFPEHIGRIMLDSAWPSDWSSPLGGHLQSEAFAIAVSDMLAACATDYAVAVCPMESEDALLQTVAQLNAQPLIASDGTAVDGKMLKGYLEAGLYGAPSYRHDRLETSGRALSGEQEAVDTILEAMRGGGAKVSLSGMVVRCLSSPRDANLIGLYRYIEEHGLPQSLGGPELTDDALRGTLDLSCDALPDSGEDYLMFSNDSEQPILIFGITGDHATPYAGARQLADELGNATLVTLEGRGHIASFADRSSCADDIAVGYLVRGEMPVGGTVCTDD